MFTKFKAALYNVVGNFDPTDGGTAATSGIVSLTAGVPNTSSLIQANTIQGREKILKYPYTRPHFLQLNSEDEILVSADHTLRPIICSRDISQIPWNSGYAETVNAGKSKRNEDQAAVHVGFLTRSVKLSPSIQACNSKVNGSDKKFSSSLNGGMQDGLDGTPNLSEDTHTPTPNPIKQLNVGELPHDSLNVESPIVNHDQGTLILPYYYFGVFDGHAGWGAAVSASNQLHLILHEKLCSVVELILPDQESENDLRGPLCPPEKTVSPESAIIGALEQAFWAMDQQIAEDRQRHNLSGGCTACIALFILGKVFVANAGDSRGIISLEGSPISMSFDFTPETETQRIRKIGARHPELLGGEFTHLEFLRRPLKSDLGKKAVYRDHYMKGWSLKTITESDLKYPLVCGEGKRSRVLATIGVTRGFGDHDLRAHFSSLPIKPFLSPEPEVRVFDLRDVSITGKDVLILGTDGLWDIMSNEKAAASANESLQQFSPLDSNRYKYRYTSAAHDLVLCSRGRLKEHNWRTADDKHATIDDISVFVIPLKPYKDEFEQWRAETVVESSEEVFEKVCLEVSRETRTEPLEAFESSLNSNAATNTYRPTYILSLLSQDKVISEKLRNSTGAIANSPPESSGESFTPACPWTETATNILPESFASFESHSGSTATTNHFQGDQGVSINDPFVPSSAVSKDPSISTNTRVVQTSSDVGLISPFASDPSPPIASERLITGDTSVLPTHNHSCNSEDETNSKLAPGEYE